ncbi:spore germination protein [Caldibacillus lycopersici]|uniref:Spore germination protein n=1 Tax=Perspicuibacillus lycopersici TaxID=1325689 RepID=A0AAE3IQD2_9BACI|nr:spore germination protein [Perspicuibacillus lycopersici]MCU9612472.1 spore germination protein [Perspicuibacillus lycopersici]
MPAIVGIVQVNSVSSSGVFHIGDVYRVSPISSAKTFSGAGSFNTGEQLYVYNRRSNTNTYDSDQFDQNITGNV